MKSDIRKPRAFFGSKDRDKDTVVILLPAALIARLKVGKLLIVVDLIEYACPRGTGKHATQ
jgi:hypothetical protein